MNATPRPIAPVIDAELLHLLLDASEPLTVEAISLRRRMPPARVISELNRLRDAGCLLEEHPQHGVRLIESGLSAWQDYLRSRLGGSGRRIEVYRRTASTQDVCRRLLASYGSGADGALAVADEQTAGRGRLGRRWVAPPGSAVTFSRLCLLDSAGVRGAVDRLTFAACVAVSGALQELLGPGERVRLKWPNDVVVHGRKLAGILVETTPWAGGAAAIIGVGINVGLTADNWPAELAHLRDQITSLALCGASVDRLRVLAEAARALDEAITATPLDALLDQWRERCDMLHRHVRLRSGGRTIEGAVLDLDPQAGLIVQMASGEIVHLPAAVTTTV